MATALDNAVDALDEAIRDWAISFAETGQPDESAAHDLLVLSEAVYLLRRRRAERRVPESFEVLRHRLAVIRESNKERSST